MFGLRGSAMRADAGPLSARRSRPPEARSISAGTINPGVLVPVGALGDSWSLIAKPKPAIKSADSPTSASTPSEPGEAERDPAAGHADSAAQKTARIQGTLEPLPVSFGRSAAKPILGADA